MPMDPVLEEYLRTLPEVVFDDTLDIPAERAREAEEALRAPRLAHPHIEDRAVPGAAGQEVGTRIYTPSEGGTGLPVTVYLHGGGFVVGGLETHDNALRLLAEEAGTIVVAADYRMAPEHPYPAAVDDAFAVYSWALRNAAALSGDPARVAVAGDSAGGFLALCTSFLAAERGVRPPVFQLLVYPGTGADAAEGFAPGGAGADAADESGGMSGAEMGWYLRTFLGTYPAADLPAYIPPGRAPDLSGLPPTFVLTAELDPLRADGAVFADRLAAAGAPVTWKDSPGLVHSFLRWMHAVPAARSAAQPAFDALRAAFSALR